MTRIRPQSSWQNLHHVSQLVGQNFFVQIFPRFYFVSNVALLDMLANGTNPPKIMPYLGDCYDSLANLTFVTLEDGTQSSKTVNEMVSSRHIGSTSVKRF